MNTPSKLMRYLLDKNVVRYAISGLYHRHLRQLSLLEISALSFWQTVKREDIPIFISYSSVNVLQRIKQKEVQFFLNSVNPLYPTRYHTRWTRRIRETTGLTREDSDLIALTTFGSNQTGNILGTHYLFTYDQGLVNGYLNHLPTLERRLKAMTTQLHPPFKQATLPNITLLNTSNITI